VGKKETWVLAMEDDVFVCIDNRGWVRRAPRRVRGGGEVTILDMGHRGKRLWGVGGSSAGGKNSRFGVPAVPSKQKSGEGEEISSPKKRTKRKSPEKSRSLLPA